MQVILTEDVADLGHKGDVVDVAAGYARNYLIPRSKAVAASRGSLRQAESMRHARVEAERRERREAELLQETLMGSRVVVAARASDEGKLYGSIGTADVVEAVKKFTGVDLDRSVVVLPEPVREIGLHEVVVRPHPEVEFTVTLDVIPA
jgi:large subunit ribosomal protein L9